ncbi:hypothetical protein GW17_00028364 [Ensete ventricosum]|nr:hypothetical protein GW17_00028364 [Ensete ventricosum]RZS08889.1 hypothetical protein BHM03_00039919 [Ensete ventricosum]
MAFEKHMPLGKRNYHLPFFCYLKSRILCFAIDLKPFPPINFWCLQPLLHNMLGLLLYSGDRLLRLYGDVGFK